MSDQTSVNRLSSLSLGTASEKCNDRTPDYLHGLNTAVTRRNSMLDYTFPLVFLLGVGLSEEETRCPAGQYLNTTNNCSACPVGTYILDTNHTLTTCFNCSEATETLQECTNVEICGPGMFRIQQSETNWICQPCTTCSNFTKSDFEPVPCEEYTDTVCCPKNEKVVVPWENGKYICASHCARGEHLLSNGMCRICPIGTYMPHNKHTNLLCKTCKVLNHPKTEWHSYKECNATHDATVQCAPGYYRKETTTKCAFSKTCSLESIGKLEAMNCRGDGNDVCCLELNCSQCEEMGRKIDDLGVVIYENGTKSRNGLVLCDFNEYVRNGESCSPCPLNTYINSRNHTMTRCYSCDAFGKEQQPTRCMNEHFLFYLIVLTIIGLLLALILTIFIVEAIISRYKPVRNTTISELNDESLESFNASKRNASSEDFDVRFSDVGAGHVENRSSTDNPLLSSIRQHFMTENKTLIDAEPPVHLPSFDSEPVAMLEKQYIGSRVSKTSLNDDRDSLVEVVEESYPTLGDGPLGIEPHGTGGSADEEEISPTSVTPRGSLVDTENVKRSGWSNLELSNTPSEKSITSKSSIILSPKQSATLASTPSATLTPKPSATLTPKLSATLTPKPSATLTPKPSAPLTPKPSVIEITPKLNFGSSVDNFDSSVDDETGPKEKKPLVSSLVKRDGKGLQLSSKQKKDEDEN